MSEATLRSIVKEGMAWHHWTVLLDFSAARRMPSGLIGAPDILFAAPRPALVWFEAKAPGESRRDSQLAWFKLVKPYLCSWHRYVVADSWDSWYAQIEDLLEC